MMRMSHDEDEMREVFILPEAHTKCSPPQGGTVFFLDLDRGGGHTYTEETMNDSSLSLSQKNDDGLMKMMTTVRDDARLG